MDGSPYRRAYAILVNLTFGCRWWLPVTVSIPVYLRENSAVRQKAGILAHRTRWVYVKIQNCDSGSLFCRGDDDEPVVVGECDVDSFGLLDFQCLGFERLFAVFSVEGHFFTLGEHREVELELQGVRLG